MNPEPENPYQPPKSRLDHADFDSSIPKPKFVQVGVMLLCISLVIECLLAVKTVSIVAGELGGMDGFLFWIATSAAVLITLLVAWLIVMIGRRRNWARVIYLIFYLLWTVSFVISIGDAFQESPAVALGSSVSNLLQVLALVFLFLPVSNAWFRARA